MSFKINTTSILDPGLCYRLWVGKEPGLGRVSIYKIPNILAERGVVNPSKGAKVTPQGVWRSACLYILDNIEEAKADTVSIYSQQGMVFDAQAEEVFYREMVAKAKQHLSRTKYRKWIIKHPGLKMYE